MNARPTFMPAKISSTPAPASDVMHTRMTTAAILSAGKGAERISAVTMDEYRMALRAEGILDGDAWKSYLERFLSPQAVDGPPSIGTPRADMVKFQEGRYLLAVIPTDLNGAAWSGKALQDGQQFYLVPINEATGLTVHGDQFPLVLPAKVREAGMLTVKFAPAKDRGLQLVEQLEAAFSRIVVAIDSGENKT